MPIFEFSCKECGNTEDKIVQSTVETIKCSKCGAESEKQDKIYKSNFQLKGKWFKTTKGY